MEHLNVLFIGNSYTYKNDLPRLFEQIVEEEGGTVSVFRVLTAGYMLEQYADPEDEYGAQVDAVFRNEKLDVVVMQEQSVTPASAPGVFYDGVRALAVRVREAGARGILYQTWGRKTGHAVLEQYGWTNEVMTRRLAAAYEAIAEELGYGLSPVGSAFFDVYCHHPEIDLYDADFTHPSPAGSYLGALCLYASIYGASPLGVRFTAGFADEEVLILQTAAQHAVYGPSIVPAGEKLSSIGVHARRLVNNLVCPPEHPIISVGLTGDNGMLCAPVVSAGPLSEDEQADLADLHYGISVIGAADMPQPLSRINDGVWSGTEHAFFKLISDRYYDISGREEPQGKYRALITYNFGHTVRLEAVGFFAQMLDRHAITVDLFISSDGANWSKVESACYDLGREGASLFNLGGRHLDRMGKTARTVSFFGMGNVQAKYARIGIANSALVGPGVNYYEIAFYGEAE